VSGLINGAPGALDQLNELAAALGNDANFASTVTNALAGKQPSIPSSTSIDGDALASSYSPAGVATIGSAGAGSWPYSAGTVLTINSINDIRTAQIIFGVYGGSQIPEASFRTYHTSGGGGGWTAPVRLWHAGNLNPDIFAPRENPTFTGTVFLDTLAATGALTGANLSGVNTGDQDLSGLAPKASPTFTGTVSLATLAATGSITGASVRATGTVMAAGGFQVG
jgi:hypothetical protein